MPRVVLLVSISPDEHDCGYRGCNNIAHNRIELRDAVTYLCNIHLQEVKTEMGIIYSEPQSN